MVNKGHEIKAKGNEKKSKVQDTKGKAKTTTMDEFRKERERLNDVVMKYADLKIKRFYSLDSSSYREGALPIKTKELLGLVASTVLRCDDCIRYHVDRCFSEGIKDEELADAMSIAMVVGGSITIPHVRRAFDAWDELKTGK